MTNTKQVKVDNWGVFFLQRLKHFFNRTDYCDLTLQFQGFAQLKVHRLVLNACTEYFEMLESTCEIYEDCLIMPDDLQVDVMVPIINFMYTGQLEYENHLFERLYSTTKIMNMSVLTKLLDAQREEVLFQLNNQKKKEVILNSQLASGSFTSPIVTLPSFPREISRKRLSGRQYGRASVSTVPVKTEPVHNVISIVKPPAKKIKYEKPRPTRYEVPEELENESLFEASFSDISYGSQPLMKSSAKEKVEPVIKIKNIYNEASCSRKFEEMQASSSSYRSKRSSLEDKQNFMDQVDEYSYQQKSKSKFSDHNQSDEDIFDTNNSTATTNDSDPLFSTSQTVVKQGGKGTATNFDHAKIISEVLKKYPHLVKSNKNIKLKIMPSSDKSSPSRQVAQSIVIEAKKFQALSSVKSERFGQMHPKIESIETGDEEWAYVNKNMDQESVAKLVSMGVGNISGPWLCLICGTPGKALNFNTYNKYYRHLADVHLEKISANICEHCGYKSGKRNHLLHHMYTKHGIAPPSQYSFPKCNQCDYVALTKAFLIKHKLTHVDNREFSCNVCNSYYKTRSALLTHIQSTGHKISPDRKTTNQCVYCNKIFLREANLYTHLKLSHKELARKDGIIDNSDDDEDASRFEDSTYEYSDSPKTEHVSIKQEHDGKIQIISNVPVGNVRKSNTKPVQRLLNTKFLNSNLLDNVKFVSDPKYNTPTNQPVVEISSESESLTNVASGIATSLALSDRIVMFNENEYVIQSEQEENDIPLHQPITEQQEAILPDLPEEYYDHSIQVSMPQQTSTSQIMTQKQMKASYKIPSADVKNQQGHHVMVPTVQQPYKALATSTPVVFTTHLSTMDSTPGVPKYVQAEPSNINLDPASGDTIMYLQGSDLNIDQSMSDNGSNIVVVYSHPIDREQFTSQYEEGEEAIVENQLGSESNLIISDQDLIEETVKTAEWNNDNLENNQNIDKTNTVDEIIDQQEIPEAENESVEISTDQNTSTEEVQPQEIIISSEDKVYCEEEVEYEETTEEVATEDESTIPEKSVIVENNQSEDVPIGVQNSDAVHETKSSELVNNQVVEWSDEEIPTKEMEHMETSVIDERHASQPEEMEVIEESIENIEKEVQKHIHDKCELNKREIQSEGETIVSTETIANEAIQNEGESIITIEEPLQVDEQVQVTEESVLESEEIVNESNIDEKQQQIVQTNETVVNVEEGHSVDDSSLVEDNTEDLSKESTSANIQQKSVEKISTLLNDWEDNDSQPETINEVEDNEPTADSIENKTKVVEEQTNGSNLPAVKVANIEKIVSDWDEEEEK